MPASSSGISQGDVFFAYTLRPVIEGADDPRIGKNTETISWLDHKDLEVGGKKNPAGGASSAAAHVVIATTQRNAGKTLGIFYAISVHERHVVGLPLIKVPFETDSFAKSCEIAERGPSTFLPIYPAENHIKLNRSTLLDHKFDTLEITDFPPIKALSTKNPKYGNAKRQVDKMLDCDAYIDLACPLFVKYTEIDWTKDSFLPTKREEVRRIIKTYRFVNQLDDPLTKDDEEYYADADELSAPRPKKLQGPEAFLGKGNTAGETVVVIRDHGDDCKDVRSKRDSSRGGSRGVSNGSRRKHGGGHLHKESSGGASSNGPSPPRAAQQQQQQPNPQTITINSATGGMKPVAVKKEPANSSANNTVTPPPATPTGQMDWAAIARGDVAGPAAKTPTPVVAAQAPPGPSAPSARPKLAPVPAVSPPNNNNNIQQANNVNNNKSLRNNDLIDDDPNPGFSPPRNRGRNNNRNRKRGRGGGGAGGGGGGGGAGGDNRPNKTFYNRPVGGLFLHDPKKPVVRREETGSNEDARNHASDTSLDKSLRKQMLSEPWPEEWQKDPEGAKKGEGIVLGLKGLSTRGESGGWNIPESNMPPRVHVQQWLGVKETDQQFQNWTSEAENKPQW